LITYTVRRIAQGLAVVVVASLITFFEAHLLPGNPARAILGVHASPAQLHAFDIENGYNQPLPVQYIDYIGRLVHGNLGFSYQLNQSVAAVLQERLPATIILVGLSVIVALLIMVPISIVQAARRNKPVDYVLTGASFVLYAMPEFWLGLMLILLLAEKVRLFPPTAPQGNATQILAHPIGLVLPVATLALGSVAAFTRYLRSSLLDNLTEDYVRTAKAKGASERRVMLGHVLRNALLPVITLVGLSLPGILSGALITESVFNYPGMGYLFFQSAQKQDYPTMLGFVVVVAVATVAGSLLADIAYAVLDPRVRDTR
jgi:peptide/nickel transport system permease protein